MRKEWLNKKYRHVYRYLCKGCGRKRITLSHERAMNEVCTHCDIGEVLENQPSLFGNE